MGSVAREQASADFNDDPTINVMLVSLMAGGVGLNLVAASRVVLFDPDWNPGALTRVLSCRERSYSTDAPPPLCSE
jgi:SNF2 family DNA or RNA helicase